MTLFRLYFQEAEAAGPIVEPPLQHFQQQQIINPVK